MNRLASSLSYLKSNYSVVVVGSGYGGGVAAARLARTGQSICVLERGKEFAPGDFPNNEADVRKEIQATLAYHDGVQSALGAKTGLYDFHLDKDISVFRGCGLGGTSLINANVSLETDPAVFNESCWPSALINDLDDGLQKGYRRAREMLEPNLYPDDGVPLAKMDALKRSAEALNERFQKIPINVCFEDRVNAFGIEQSACRLCGDCVTGCNYGSKNTVAMNYLPDARQHGAEIFTEVQVRRVERTFNGKHWRIYYLPCSSGSELADETDEKFITANCVVLAGGTLGSTEILLRSKEHGLAVSDQLGKSFSGNADVLGFSYNSEKEIHAVGMGENDPEEMEPVGPCITAAIDARADRSLHQQFLLQEGSLPGALAKLYPTVLAAAVPISSSKNGNSLGVSIKEKWRTARQFFGGLKAKAINRTQVFLVMAYDSAAGVMTLNEDQLRIDWPGVSAEKIFEDIKAKLRNAAQANGGVYIPNPSWSEQVNSQLTTIHPLGGCAMADTASIGVTNHMGQVFADKQGEAVHDGLFVADGALIPMSLGTNPLLTISALVERNMTLLAEQYGWEIDENSVVGSKYSDLEFTANQSSGIQSTERMRGYWSPESGEESDYKVAYRAGKDSDQKFELKLTLNCFDFDEAVRQMKLENGDRKMSLSGVALVPILSGQPLELIDGYLQLQSSNVGSGDTLQLNCSAIMVSQSGEHWVFSGHKVLDSESEFDVSESNLSLYFSIYELKGDRKKFLGKGLVSPEKTE